MKDESVVKDIFSVAKADWHRVMFLLYSLPLSEKVMFYVPQRYVLEEIITVIN